MVEHDLTKRVERLELRVQKLDRLVWKLYQVTSKLMDALKPLIHPGEEK